MTYKPEKQLGHWERKTQEAAEEAARREVQRKRRVWYARAGRVAKVLLFVVGVPGIYAAAHARLVYMQERQADGCMAELSREICYDIYVDDAPTQWLWVTLGVLVGYLVVFAAVKIVPLTASWVWSGK